MKKIKFSMFSSMVLVTSFLFSSLSVEGRGITVQQPVAEEQERRTALVIGNGNYKSSPLRNPINDAKGMARALRELGFDVEEKIDLNQREMKMAIDDFGQRIRGGVGLFYYAGHGVQVNGSNYLIPLGVKIDNEGDIEYEAVDVGRVLSKMEASDNVLNIVILDACRDNPFGRSFRSATRGLAYMNAPKGTIIAYATAPGSAASDGSGDHGLYTGELIKNIKVPGLKIEDVFKRVRSSVLNATNDKQVPWESVSIIGDFYFNTQQVEILDKPDQIEAQSVPVSVRPEDDRANTIGKYNILKEEWQVRDENTNRPETTKSSGDKGKIHNINILKEKLE